jgi:hypothetical protein
MGAGTRVYVRVAKLTYEIVEVSALGLHDALDIAEKLPDVISAVRAAYDLAELADEEL